MMTLFFLKMDSSASIFSPVFWYLSFHGLVFVVKPILFVLGEYSFIFSYIGYFPEENDLLKTLVVTDLALLAYFSGSFLKNGCTSSVRINLNWGVVYIRSFQLMSIIVLPLIIFSFVTSGSGFSYDGSTKQMMEMVGGVSINVNSTGYVTELKNMMTPYFFLLFVMFGGRKWVWLVLGFYFVYRVYLGWERVHLVVLIISLMLLWLNGKGRKWIPSWWVVVFVLLVPLFSFLGENRNYVKSIFDDSVALEVVDHSGGLDSFDNLDFANFEYLAYIISVVPRDSQTYTYGAQYLQIFTEPVPRVLWPGKPIGEPVKLVDLNEFGNFVGLTKSVVGDAWLNLGYLGVIVNLFFLGYFLKYLYFKIYINGSNIAKISWVMLIPFSLQLFRDGGIVTITKFLLFSFFPVFLWLLFILILRKSDES